MPDTIMQTEGEQRRTVEKVTAAVTTAVERAVRIIAADGRPVMIGTLKQVQVKDGIVAQVVLSKSDPLRYALLDSQGDSVLIVCTGTDAYEGERAAVEITPDQPTMLDGDGEDDDGSVFDNTPAGR